MIQKFTIREKICVFSPFIVIVFAAVMMYMVAPRREEPAKNSAPPITQSEYEFLFVSCIDSIKKSQGSDRPDFLLYRQIWEMCETHVYDLVSLRDFDIRKEKFRQQGFADTVLLFMVVTITLSGVVLASLQLWTSYKLVSTGFAYDALKDSTLTIENNKISVRSSTTGLLILVVSLAFFIIYVIWIYSIHEISISQQSTFKSDASTPIHNPIPGPAGLGPAEPK